MSTKDLPALGARALEAALARDGGRAGAVLRLLGDENLDALYQAWRLLGDALYEEIGRRAMEEVGSDA